MEIEVINPGAIPGRSIAGVCPHCRREVIFTNIANEIQDMRLDHLLTGQRVCPNPDCRRLVFVVIENGELTELFPPVPVETGRPELPDAVTSPYRDDYKEAGLVLNVSPKASAALSRRILQQLIRDIAGIQRANLSQEIDELIANGGLPSRITESVDAIRNIGNFAAHPLKSTNTGEIVEVEPGEAEWNLDVLDMLFDHYFIQPALVQAKKDALNKKLQDAGKPPMK